MPSFAENYQHKALLNISKEHLDAIDPARVIDGTPVGQDNFDKLMVSSVFAAIAIEAALNDYLSSHFLLLEDPYLQNFFGETKDRLLKDNVDRKISMLRKSWPTRLSDDLVKDVLELFKVRNRIVHMTPEFVTATKSGDGESKLLNARLSKEQMLHMMRHCEIAREFLSLFWYPGSREIMQGQSPGA